MIPLHGPLLFMSRRLSQNFRNFQKLPDTFCLKPFMNNWLGCRLLEQQRFESWSCSGVVIHEVHSCCLLYWTDKTCSPLCIVRIPDGIDVSPSQQAHRPGPLMVKATAELGGTTPWAPEAPAEELPSRLLPAVCQAAALREQLVPGWGERCSVHLLQGAAQEMLFHPRVEETVKMMCEKQRDVWK